MLGHRLYTKQTGREGKPVSKLIMCEKLFTRREYYFACKDDPREEKGSSTTLCSLLVALERSFGGPVIITSTQGGGNIEEIAAENPDAIIRYPIDINTGLAHSDALNVAGKLGFRNQALEQVRTHFVFVSISVVEVVFSRLLTPW